MTETPVLEPPETKKINQEPRRVFVKNDDVNDMGHVAVTFMKVLAWDETKAVKKMYEIHEKGEGMVFEGHYERAELICEQLQDAQLDARLV